MRREICHEVQLQQWLASFFERLRQQAVSAITSMIERKLLISRHFPWRRIVDPAACLAAMGLAWTALIAFAPVAPTLVAVTAYGLGAVVCHQLADRSFHVAGEQLAVCARCTGIYAGATVVWVWQWVRWRAAAPIERSPVRDTTAGSRVVLLLGLLPTLVTVAAEQIGLWYPSNGVRAAAGLPLGMAVALVTGRAATLHLLDRWRQRRLA